MYQTFDQHIFGVKQYDDSLVLSIDYRSDQISIKMRLLFRPRFFSAVEKHFVDDYYHNARAVSSDHPGNLAKLCDLFSTNEVNLSYLRTHFRDHKKGDKDRLYEVDFSYHGSDRFNFDKAKTALESTGMKVTESDLIKVPWFPRNIKDINKIGQVLLDVNESKEHSQFQDPDYRKRRDEIAQIALNYKMGEPIPDVKYSSEQNDLWKVIYAKLNRLHQKSMSSKFLEESELLNKELNVANRIPQLKQLSDYLTSRTGFTIKPTHGILSQREFLNAFAFKVFCCTQYLRNNKNPDYTPQPDIVHEIVGHVPMFANKEVAELSHLIGLLSLGASDEEVAKLGTLYWYTLEFGVCMEGSTFKGYGAGIASSIGQIEHMTGRHALFKKLDIFHDSTAPYPVQTVQPCYRVTESFEQSLRDLEEYGKHIMKPITTVFNEHTNQIEYDRGIEGVFTDDKGPKF